MARKDWTRWIFASVADYLKQVAAERNLPVLVEHLDDRTEAFMQAADRAEIRITGPFIQELSRGYWRAFVDVNVLLTSRYDGSQKDAYSILKHAGALQDALSSPMGIWNFGNEPGDFVEGEPETQKFVGCLVPRSKQAARVFHFGQIHPTDRVRQTEIDSRHVLELSD